MSAYASGCREQENRMRKAGAWVYNNNNNNNGNFICVFECTIVNLAMYRQFTNAA